MSAFASARPLRDGAAGALQSGSPALQLGSTTAEVVSAAAAVVGLALVAGGLAAVVALLYRWYVRERVAGGLPALVGLSGVALYLGSSQALRNVITPPGPLVGTDPLSGTAALFNIVTFAVSLAATRAGTDIGDRIANDVFVATGSKAVESEVSRVVQAVGRVITVEIPEEIDDIVGYDPVPAQTKEALSGKTFVFPRRLTVDELRDRLVTRLKADYAVGHVDVELGDDGTVEYLALGSRAAGIGPTLPPETSAVAVRADPAFAASAGDLVQVWRTDPGERVLTAELRGKVDDVVTLAVDAADTRKLDDTTEYRLVTLPVETRPDREFASVLRAADETMATVAVGAGSSLAGQPVGALAVTVVAIRPSEGPVEPLPARDRVLAAGDCLYLVATPEAIRRVEAAAGPDSAADSGAEMPPDERVDPATPVAGESAARTDVPESDPASADANSDAGSPGHDTPEDSETRADPLAGGPSDEATVEAADASASEPGRDGETDSVDRGEPELADLGTDETDDGTTGTDAEAGGESENGEESAEPTRSDLDDIAGTDVDDLPGTDIGAGDGSDDADEEWTTAAENPEDDDSKGSGSEGADGEDDDGRNR